ncbi:MAG: type II toxin-antitoxin system RelE/ParE family toxin [Patescibacteria group bacterium]
MNYNLASRAQKRLLSIDRNEAKKILKKLDILFALENPLYQATKLQGYDKVYRFRIGDYRTIFTITNGEGVVLWVSHRKDVYKEF